MIRNGVPEVSVLVKPKRGAERFQEARRTAASSHRNKNLSVGQVWEGHGQGLSVGLKEVLLNRHMIQEGEAGLTVGQYEEL